MFGPKLDCDRCGFTYRAFRMRTVMVQGRPLVLCKECQDKPNRKLHLPARYHFTTPMELVETPITAYMSAHVYGLSGATGIGTLETATTGNTGVATGSENYVTLPAVQPSFAAMDVDNNVLYVYQPTSPLTAGIVITMVDLVTGVATDTSPWYDEITISVTAMACVQGILYVRTGTSFVDYGYIATYDPGTDTWDTITGYSPPDQESWLVSKNNEALIFIHKAEGSGGPDTWEIREFAITGGAIVGSPATYVVTSVDAVEDDRVFDFTYLDGYLYATVSANGGGFFASGVYKLPYGTEGYEAITFTGADTTPEDGLGVAATYRATTSLTSDGDFLYIRDCYTVRSYNLATTETVTMLGVNNSAGDIDGDIATSRLPVQRDSGDTGFPGDIVYNPNDNCVYLVYNPRIRKVTLA